LLYKNEEARRVVRAIPERLRMRIAIGQINPTVGDIDGNISLILEVLRKVHGEADLLVVPELAITGYPPRDLLEKRGFLDRAEHGVKRLCAATEEFPQTGLLFGAPMPTGRTAGYAVYNAAVLADAGEMVGVHHKSLLPSYDVFDETRYFERACGIDVIPYKGEKLGVLVCEDAWNDPAFWPGTSLYTCEPVGELAGRGATIFVNLSASPFNVGKDAMRYELVRSHATRHGVPFVYANQVGGNDELVFDGRSMFVDAAGSLVNAMSAFESCVDIVDTNDTGAGRTYQAQNPLSATHDALVLGLRDYLGKCGFQKAAIGLSGGIDSALTAALAAEALGPDNVTGIAMPSQYSHEGSTSYSRELAANLGIGFHVVPIWPVYEAYAASFKDLFGTESQDGVTFENIQARIRGNILMAFSNYTGCMVLTTGNKSEMAVGYCTLYGDMAGGLAVIADVPKTTVYELAHFVNRCGEVIPRWIMERPPSAELRPNQKDQDTLPAYDVLDRILVAYVEQGKSVEEIARSGISADSARWVVNAVNRSEYKRRQAAPGLRVTSKAFGVGRRIPIAARTDE
jgi:NAD+ synthase (glutamine-hydrolysing)